MVIKAKENIFLPTGRIVSGATMRGKRVKDGLQIVGGDFDGQPVPESLVTVLYEEEAEAAGKKRGR